MKNITLYLVAGLLGLQVSVGIAAEAPISEQTEDCLACHAILHPGIVEDWKKSRHARITVKEAMAVEGLARKVSSTSIPEKYRDIAIGCAECHTMRPDAHEGTVDHLGHRMHIVVSPDDCRTCHDEEAEQFEKNLMSHAYGNLANNSLYNALEHSILGQSTHKDGKLLKAPASDLTKEEACYYCHGTKLEVTGYEVRDTELAGELSFPRIKGWPNQGVGRINLDGSRGSCSACHTRHAFSIEMARKPYTCKECHHGPDVPAFKVYEASKHGNIFSAKHKSWDFTAVPWTIGKDFTAPVCATCHVSLVVDTEGEVVAKRTHRMNDRLPWRLFGLIYSHPHPRDPDTTIIRNKDGIPLPTDFAGGFAEDYLIDAEEMTARKNTMQRVCRSCHGKAWVDGHWTRFNESIKQTNNETLAATGIMQEIWERGLADSANPFDEFIEGRWTDSWLIYANTIRFSSAMGGGGDYTVFADGRYQFSKQLRELEDWLALHKQLRHLSEEKKEKDD
ncbi:MAG: multiheme c-type cytochrome [Desulfurivibrionaceae bacterium]